MREDRHTNPIDEILASIKRAVSEAYQAFERGAAAAWRIQGAFVRMRVLLEAAGLPTSVY